MKFFLGEQQVSFRKWATELLSGWDLRDGAMKVTTSDGWDGEIDEERGLVMYGTTDKENDRRLIEAIDTIWSADSLVS